MVYEDEGRELVFEAPMGRAPYSVYVPTADVWSARVPPWARDRRNEILATIRQVDGVDKVVEEANVWVMARNGA